MTENRWSREDVLERLGDVRERISAAAEQSGRKSGDIALMAVTKTVPAEVVNLVAGAGVQLFGENRAQELCEKSSSYSFGSDQIHFIGSLQTNKVRQIIDKVSCIQSVDSLRLANEISKRAVAIGSRMPIMLEVNIAGETSKGGIPPDLVEDLLEKAAVLPGLSVTGLMTIPPANAKSDELQRYFDQMNKLFVDIKHKKIDNVNMVYLSMGMSSDYEQAIRSGANLVRVGSGIFGRRSYT